MILHTRQDKVNFLKECSDNIVRIKNTPGLPDITQAKLLVLNTIYDAVNQKDIDEGEINLESVYREIKAQLNGNELAKLPRIVIVNTASNNVDTIMTSHREGPTQYGLSFLLNLLGKEPASTLFLKRTGFFAVEGQAPDNLPVLDKAAQYK